MALNEFEKLCFASIVTLFFFFFFFGIRLVKGHRRDIWGFAHKHFFFRFVEHFFFTGLLEVRVGVRKNPVLYLLATVE